jgi:hypothetical protein
MSKRLLTVKEAAAGRHSLTDLAARVNAEHQAVTAAVKRGVEHAVNAGKLLIEAKDQLAHGQWLPWLKDHCTISERTAQLYMRLARRVADLEAKSASLADLTMEDAISLISPVAPVQHSSAIHQFLTQLHGDRESGH